MKSPFLGPAYTARSRNLAADRAINIYPESSPVGRDAGAFIGTPGLKLWRQIASNGQVRGLHAALGALYAVVETTIYRITEAGTVSAIGSCAGSGPVSMTDNGTSVLIADGVGGALVTGSTVMTPGGGYPTGCESVTSLDTYLVAVKPGTDQFFIAGPSSTTFDPLDFASAEGAPDDLVAAIADHRELWLFGEETTEVWYNSGAADFPFSRIGGAYMEQGCAAAHSVAKMDNSIYWIGRNREGDGIVWRAAGYQPQRLSTHAIESAMAGYSTIEDAIAYCYQQEGHSFYVLSFPSGNATWVFDAATGLWHQRAYLDSTGELDRHRGNCYAFFAGRHWVGDVDNGRLYELDLDTYTDDGVEILRLRAWGHQHGNGAYVKVRELEVFGEYGTGPGNPQLRLRVSDDGGHTWSNELWRSAGRIGERRARAVWQRLGVTRDRVYELALTDPIKVCWIAAEVR